MKQILASLLALSAVATQASADVVLFEDFEDATVTYTIDGPAAEYSDGFGDFFTRTDGTNVGTFYVISGVQGSSYFAGMDLDADGGTNPASLTFTADITGYENLSFSSLFAEDDDGTNQDWDSSDSFTVTASIDGSAPVLIFGIANDGTGFNAAPLLDTDLDGTGDGTEITNTLTEYGAAIAGTGSSLELVLTFDLDSGDEDLAIDNFTIMGDLTTAPVPEPTAALFGSLLAGALGMTVARRPNSRD